MRRRPLLTIALALAMIKAFQFAVDSQALFFNDSGAFILNALGWQFLPERSYVYSWLIGIFAVPFHSLRAIAGMQMLMGAATAWLLAFLLIRYFHVRGWIGMLAALVFAFDPLQVVYEHLVMTETTALLAAALFLATGLQYLRRPKWQLLVLLSLLGALLVSLRTVYVPVAVVCAPVVPLLAYLRGKKAGTLALGLAVSCGSMVVCQSGYRYLTGWLSGQEPAYHYQAGFFQAGVVAPLIEPGDSDDSRVAKAVTEQSRSGVPLRDRELRPAQVWAPGGLAARLKAVFHGDTVAANRAAEDLARAAIARNPLGFLRLGFESYLDFWRVMPRLRWRLPWEVGAQPAPVLTAYDVEAIQRTFGVDVSRQHLWVTPSRRYSVLGRWWGYFLLASPFLTCVATYSIREDQPGAIFLCVWSLLLLGATCLGGSEPVFRYLHPFSFTGLAACGMLAETWITRREKRFVRSGPPTSARGWRRHSGSDGLGSAGC